MLVDSMNLFKCIDLEGSSYLIANINIECKGNPKYDNIFVPVGIGVIAFWGVILPGFLFYKVKSSRNRAKTIED